jgi:hypothetical protein
MKADILAEIDYCTRHTLYLIEKYSERRQITPPKKLVFEPRQAAPTPQAHVPPKLFAEKVAIMDKMPVAEKVPNADSSVQFEAEASATRIPPKIFMDAKLPAVDNATLESGQSVEGVEAVATPDSQNEDSGAIPFLLATPHHARNWQTMDLFTVEELLAENERKAAEIKQAIEELNDLSPSRHSGTQEYRRLEALHEQQRTLESEREILAARKDTLTGAG